MIGSAARTSQSGYIGRFAPSPSGPLHMGSLVCAIASFIDAKSHNGQWLIRIEDIDPPREMPGASQGIIESLARHQLISDAPIIYQSERSDAYDDTLTKLHQLGLTYYCQCTRKRLKSLAGVYDGFCRDQGHHTGALKLNVKTAQALGAHLEQSFDDGICGQMQQSVEHYGDFVIHRKDGLYAYQLAVVVDDIAQQISHVVRGQDLLETTFQQRLLYQLLGHQAPQHMHVPLVMAEDGRKLSKQNGAPALDDNHPERNIREALGLLGITPIGNTCEQLLAHAVAQWPAAVQQLQRRHTPTTLQF